MFLDWYALDLPSQVGGRETDAPTLNAFEGLERSDVALVVAAAVALICAIALLAGKLAESPLPALVLLGAGACLLLAVLYRGTSRPIIPFFAGEEVDTVLAFGWFVALAAAGLVTLGGVWAYLAGPRLEFEDDEGEWEEDEASSPRPDQGS